jgi:hypothetical protein
LIGLAGRPGGAIGFEFANRLLVGGRVGLLIWLARLCDWLRIRKTVVGGRVGLLIGLAGGPGGAIGFEFAKPLLVAGLGLAGWCDWLRRRKPGGGGPVGRDQGCEIGFELTNPMVALYDWYSGFQRAEGSRDAMAFAKTAGPK